MLTDKTKLLAAIAEAFKDVQLENGIGLSEATAIDEYGDSIARAECRNSDEKNNWNAISSDALNENYTSLSFFDAKGMRFHLPAFLIAEIKGKYRFGMAFALTTLSDYSLSQFALFSPLQKKTVCLFLGYLSEQPDYEFERDEIKRAIQNYWAK